MTLSGETVVVGCSIPGGVRIGHAWGTDLPNDPLILKGPPVVASRGAGVEHAEGRYGTTRIPIEHWTDWYSKNATGPLVRGGGVWLIA
jgi:hypothetical protein